MRDSFLKTGRNGPLARVAVSHKKRDESLGLGSPALRLLDATRVRFPAPSLTAFETIRPPHRALS